nr:MAG TPA: hypothetical protein [Bacteriophage sp.]
MFKFLTSFTNLTTTFHKYRYFIFSTNYFLIIVKLGT